MAIEWDVFSLAAGAAAQVTLATSAAADDIVDTAAAHGFSAGDAVVFTTLTGGAGLVTGHRYYVIAANLAATTFQVSLTAGGAAVNFTTDITAGSVQEVVPATYLATLYEAREKTIRVERDGPGAAQFAINRTSPECTETILAQGNLVKVRIPEIWTDYIYAFFLETGDFTLISSQEAGGEMLTFGGRGILSYLEYARADRRSYITGGQDPIAGVWRAYAAGTGAAPGQILRRMIEEMQHVDRIYGTTASHPLALLTIDFDYTNDSTTDPWDTTDATDEFSYQVGEDGLAILARLIETDTITVQMSPAFLLSAYNRDTFGRNLAGDAFGAGVVRFQRGTNIAIELRREQTETRVGTHALVQGEADKYGGAVLADAAARVTKEVFVQSFGTGTTALNGIGAADLADRLKKSDSIQFQIANRRTAVELDAPVTVGATVGAVALDGFYLPGPAGTLGDFWVGDTVRVHTGTGQFDYDEVDALVEAITITRDDDNKELIVIPELTEAPLAPLCLAAQNSVIESGNRDAITSWVDTGLADLRGTTWAYVATNPFHSDNAITSPWTPGVDPITALFTWRVVAGAPPGGVPAAAIDIDLVCVNLSPLPLSQGSAPPFTALPVQTGTFTVPSTDPTAVMTHFGFTVTADYGAGTPSVNEGYQVCLTRIA